MMKRKEWESTKTDLLEILNIDLPDNGVIEIINAFNAFPNFATFSSCEGHGEHPKFHIYFWTFDMSFSFVDDLIISVKEAAEKSNICLGCLRLSIQHQFHFDCSHSLKESWELTIEPRDDYGDKAKSHIDIIVKSITEKLIELRS